MKEQPAIPSSEMGWLSVQADFSLIARLRYNLGLGHLFSDRKLTTSWHDMPSRFSKPLAGALYFYFPWTGKI